MQNRNIFTNFLGENFWQLFSRNQSCQQLKSPWPQHFHEFFTPKKSTIFSRNQSWIFGQKMKISNSVKKYRTSKLSNRKMWSLRTRCWNNDSDDEDLPIWLFYISWWYKLTKYVRTCTWFSRNSTVFIILNVYYDSSCSHFVQYFLVEFDFKQSLKWTWLILFCQLQTTQATTLVACYSCWN